MPQSDLASSIAAAPPALPRPDGSGPEAADWLNRLPADHALHRWADLPAIRQLLQALADHSPYLWRLATADADRLAGLLGQAPDSALGACLERLSADCTGAAAMAELMAALRRAKADVALLVALADLSETWTLEEVTGALSDFADRAVRLAVAFLLRAAERDGKLVAAEGSPEAGCGFAVLALGKGGARELNYSSDIDLVLFFDPGAPRLAPATVPPVFYIRLAKDLVKILGERTAEGYVLRVDLRLRPDPGSTGIAVSWPAALNYYEASGQTWERAAYIKARPVAGDLALGAAFLAELAPFVWRRYFDYAAVEDIHAMKRQIHAFRGHGDVAVAGHDLKVGRGGIREVEFFVQTQQLIFGGRRAALRGPRTLDMLDALAADGWITAEAAADLAKAYGLLRRIEHRLQMIADEQTQRLPVDPADLEKLALFSGYPDRAAFEVALVAEMRSVEAHYARLFERGSDGPAVELAFSGDTAAPGTVEALRGLGFAQPEAAVEIVRGWHFGRRPALRGTRAREILARLAPLLLDAFAHAGDPDVALARFDAALGRLPAAAELFAILLSHEPLRQLYADMLGVAPRLAAAVAAHPHLLDVALDPTLGGAAPERGIEARIAEADSTEEALDRARDLAREEGFPIGLGLLSGATAPRRAAERYSALAEQVLRALLARVEADLAGEHGRVPGGAVAVVAMGKLGSREMTAASDLDLLIVYDAAGPDSDGPRPLAPSRYYARLTQRLIAALTAATRRGTLYGVDMRLRPSGSQGPLATRLSAFVQYHAAEAETWERMALTRARVVAGDSGFGERVGEAVRDILTRAPSPELGREVSALRALVESGKPHGGPWDLKLAPGGQLDVEFLAQFLVLRHAGERPALMGLSTEAVFEVAAGLIPDETRATLGAAARLYTDVTQLLRLAVDGPFDPAQAGQGLRRRLSAAVGLPDLATLERHIAETRAAVRAIFDALLVTS